MNTKQTIAMFLVLVIVLALTGCSSSVPVGAFSCSIPVAIQGQNDIVILSFTLTSTHSIKTWSLFDFGTRSVLFGEGGKASLSGGAIQFNVTDRSFGNNFSYKINGTFVSSKKLSGDYDFNYGSSYGEVASKFDCDLAAKTQNTPTP